MGEAASPDRGGGAVVCCPAIDGLCPGCAPPARISVAVMRHGERLDAADPCGWFQSPAAKRYPFDCPLSPQGRRRVGSVARELAQRSSGSFSCVVSSPFLRCVETAVEVCHALGLPICIDMQLGEVFGPACFGEWSAPGPMRRNAEEVMALVPPDLRRLSPVDLIGEEPAWPESVEEARLRLVARVEQCPPPARASARPRRRGGGREGGRGGGGGGGGLEGSRGCRAPAEYAEWAARLEGANFVLVTHGDCVGACLTLAMARADGTLSQVVDKVDYCGYALLERVWEPGEPAHLGLLDEAARWRVRHGHVVMRDMGDPPEPDPDRREEAAQRSGEDDAPAKGPAPRARDGEAAEAEYFNDPWNGCRVTSGVICI